MKFLNLSYIILKSILNLLSDFFFLLLNFYWGYNWFMDHFTVSELPMNNFANVEVGCGDGNLSVWLSWFVFQERKRSTPVFQAVF